MLKPAYKNESPVSAGQFVKTLSNYATDFIAYAGRLVNTNPEFSFLVLVLTLQFVAMFGGAI
jgi:hypothetical protein